MYASENQVFSTWVLKKHVPKELLILGNEVEQKTSPLSWSPLWKNGSSLQETATWLSTLKENKKRSRERKSPQRER